MLSKINYKDNINIIYITLDIHSIVGDQVYTRGGFSKDVYTRCFLHRILPNLDKILFLDVDIIITTDIAELFNIDMEDYPIAAVGNSNKMVEEVVENLKRPGWIEKTKEFSQYGNMYEYRTKYLGLTDDELRYFFNSGTILFNLKKSGEVIDRGIKKLINKKYALQDMDILNILFKKNALLLDHKYCILPERVSDFMINHGSLPDIIHYAGPRKPNFHGIKNLGGAEYWKTLQETDFFYPALEELIDSKLAKIKREIGVITDDKLAKSIKIDDMYHKLKLIKRSKRRQRIIRLILKPLVNKKRYRKLKANPDRFFADSKSRIIRFMGRFYK